MTENPTMARNRRYTETFRDGMRAAGVTVIGHLTRAQANDMAKAMPVMEGDAFLAGYYAELRRMRLDTDGASL
jgi:hypothetical protein